MKLANRLYRCTLQLAAVLLFGIAALPSAFAQSEGDDPPGRVGRLADLTGQVWLFTTESGEWVNATRNRPLTAGDRLSTDPGARAEVRIGSTTLRLDGGSELEVMRLDDERVGLQLHNGSVAARLRSRETAAEFDLMTAEGQFTVQRAGRYRFDRMDGTSHLTVYSGQALYEGPRSALTVNSGQRAEFWIDASDRAQYSITEPQRDAFSAWNSERDRSDDRSVSARYVSPEMTGMEDLDRYGRWEQSPEYGSIWIPRAVAPDWAPYSTGHWSWVRPWGWTWIDDAPWGFAPFHYGRWVWHRSVWCWAPGTYVARPIYAPALVAWVGGPSVSLSLTIGGGFAGPAVGWFPLAPREVYVPSYRHSPRYVRQVNVTHVTNITNITNVINAPGVQRDFSNRKFPHAVTVVPTSVITGQQAVGPAYAQVRDAPGVRELTREPARHGALLAPPVAAPVAVVRSGDPRPGVGPVLGSDRNRTQPPVRVERPGQRGGESDRTTAPVAAPVTPGPQGPVMVGRPAPSATVPAPAQATVAPTVPGVTAPPPSRQIVAPRPVQGEPSTRGTAPARPVPAPVPTPQVRGGSRQAPVQDGRQAGSPPAGAPGVGPVLSAPRGAQADRATPDKRHHAPVAAPAAQPKPAEASAKERAAPKEREEKVIGPQNPRERNMAN